MPTQLQKLEADAAVFTISVAAELAGMHPQTLRTYDRMGLVRPERSRGRGRRYSPRDVAKLRLIQHLSQDEGINLQGIRRILDMESELDLLRAKVEQLTEMLDETRRQTMMRDPRVFTAESSGAVHLGRRRIKTQQLALPGR